MRVLTDKERDQVETLAPYLTQEQIAAHLSMSVDTLARIFERDPDVLMMYRRGKAKAIFEIAENLVQKAIGGDFQSQRFYLMTQAGWSETVKNEHTSPDGSMSPKSNGPVAIYALPDNGRDKPEPDPAPDPRAKAKPKAKVKPRAKAKPRVKSRAKTKAK